MRTLPIKSLLVGTALSGAATAAEILVTSDVITSTTWTANNTYNLQQQIYVRPGATLTIEAGTVIASDTSIGGSLAVTKGARIFVLGTDTNPVIFTSKADQATWVGGNPKTGTWRETANEWGNLTLMGAGYVSENAIVANTAVPSASNIATMEGLIAAFPGDTRVNYGGGDDNDDSGTIQYCSLRYTGRVIGLGNELNGMSLGGVGRETDVHHVEIMNNVDDGIEVWGGAVNLKNFAIWNIGDDSLDVDQGWRGKAQFGLIVQGWSLNASSGSGVCDNGFEMDGAENSDWQPVTTSTLYNMTFIGQPLDGDHATAWRDNARVQFRNSIFMDTGRRLVSFDNVDGDGGSGYGFNGTLSWANTWTTPYTATSAVNAPANPAAFYTVQTSGNLTEITDSVFFNNNNSAAYTEADARGVRAPANNNVTATLSPIRSITRGASVVKGGRVLQQVLSLDPRPANDAVVSVGWAANDGFFTSARYRGAFGANNNWLGSWTASFAFGFTAHDGFYDLGKGLPGVSGEPILSGTGSLIGGQSFALVGTNAAPSTLGVLAVGVGQLNFPLFGGTLCPNILAGFTLNIGTNGNGTFSFPSGIPAGTPAGVEILTQALYLDAAAPQGFSFSNALKLTTQL
ncbi:MAG: hypothetical protein IPN34_19995 [Planctomycetes bacterium]|nr:hypothetical protein [Planctomycetota bacterium]